MAPSRAIFGHEFATMDILTGLYFAPGGLGSIYLGRRLKLSPWSVIFAAVSWTCNPFLVYLNVSWPMAPLVAFLPWVVGSSLALRERVTRGRVIVFVLAHLGLLFGGYIPWFVDAVLFEILAHLGLSALAWRRGSTPRQEGRNLLRIAAPLALVALLGLPLLLPMGYQTTLSADRAVPLTYAEYSANAFRLDTWSNGVLFPFARLAPRTDDNAFIDYSSPAGLAHLGYIPLVLAALALRRQWRRRRASVPMDSPANDPFWPVAAFLALVALLWALGILALPIYYVPVLNRFRWPFKMLGFANFFFAWLAARELHLEVSTPTRPRRAFALGALVVLLRAGNLVGVNLGHSFRGNLRHADSIPLSEPRAAELHGSRAAALATPSCWAIMRTPRRAG